jgi:hypothetical protein
MGLGPFVLEYTVGFHESLGEINRFIGKIQAGFGVFFVFNIFISYTPPE